MVLLNPRSTTEVCKALARRIKERRLELNLTQAGLALRADINIDTYRKFERTAKISLAGLAKIAYALQSLDDLDLLFAQKNYRSIEDVLESGQTKRKRGKNT